MSILIQGAIGGADTIEITSALILIIVRFLIRNPLPFRVKRVVIVLFCDESESIPYRGLLDG